MKFTTAVLISMVCLVCVIGVLIIVSEQNTIAEIKDCDLIDSCDKHNCKAEAANTYHEQTNYLIKYQNCLLEKKEVKK